MQAETYPMNPELNELIDLLGIQRVSALLGRFGAELHAFEAQCAEYSDASAQAHRLISQAGMLGFHALSQAARDYETAASTNAPLALFLAAVRDEARAVQSVVDRFASAMMTDLPASRPS